MDLLETFSVGVTPLGMPFLLVCGLLLLLRPAWLIPLLIVAAVLHAPAVAIVHVGDGAGAIGLSPWLVASVAVIAHLAWRWGMDQRLSLPDDRKIRLLLVGWSAFALLAVLGAFALPHLFQGVMVFSLAQRLGFDAHMTPLAWSFVNAVQAFNLGVLWLLLLAMAKASQEQGFARRVMVGFGLAIVVSVGLSLYQRGLSVQVIPDWGWFADSLNPSYVQVAGSGLSVPRLPWPFSESSYASIWFAAIYGAGLSLMLLSKRWLLGALGVLAGIVGLLNAFGTAGLASAGLISVMVAGVVIQRCVGPHLQHGPPRPPLPWKPFAGVIVVVLAAAALALMLSGMGSPLAIWDKLIVPRLLGQGISGANRATSNWHALELVAQTYGLGTGLGSNRASSYTLSMLSNVGVILSAGFFALTGYQAWLLLARARDRAMALFLVFGAATSFIGVCLAIPDFSWPAWWIWILCMFGMAAGLRQPEDTPVSG